LIILTHQNQSSNTKSAMSNQHQTNPTKKSSKKAKAKACKKATSRKHNRARPDRKQRARFLKAFEQMLSIELEGSAVIFRVGMAKDPEQKAIKNKSKNKAKQAWQPVKSTRRSEKTKPSVLTFPPPTFVLDQDQAVQLLTFHPPTFGWATPAVDEEPGSSFAKNQRVAFFHKVSDTWIENTHVVGVHHDDGVDQPYYTIRYQQSDSEEPIEKQTTCDRLKISAWDEAWTISTRATSMDA
jgi:hypothetical protein